MSQWLTVCVQDEAPYALVYESYKPYTACQPRNLRSLKVDEDMPPLDPVIIGQCFMAGLAPVITCFLISRGLGVILSMVRGK